MFKSPVTCHVVAEKFDDGKLLNNLRQEDKLKWDPYVKTKKEQVPVSTPITFSEDR